MQERSPGAEHTVDVLVLRDGRCRVAGPRKRTEVRAGEAKGVTVRHEPLQALARGIAGALPGAYGVLNVQVFADGDELRVIKVNARYGGGFPLAYEAGARLRVDDRGAARPAVDRGRRLARGLVMLRYDEAVFVDEAAIPSASSAYQLG